MAKKNKSALPRHGVCLIFSILLTVTAFGRGLPAGASDRSQEDNPMTTTEWTGKRGDDWKEVDRLVEEQKFEGAAKLVETMLERARTSRDNEEWVRCLIWTVRLRTVLHGFETAVKFLKTEPWPEGSPGRSVLNLYYAHSLLRYARGYSWEIHKRERVETKGEVDLKAWTMDQIFQEAQHAFDAVWQTRESLGDAPVSMLAEYIEPNNYPPDVRPTLRCAASYLYVEMLADESFWRPEHANEIFMLNLDALLAMDEKEAGSATLADPSVHPLVKICAILADLEGWCRDRQAREAGLEARLERLRRLHASFDGKGDRARIKADLSSRLQQNDDLPWWAMGMALLAEFTRDEETADNLIRAR
ncbi:MAG: hypothetical protein GY859_18760, partial [Desulfobacterales bacterium]|nr:hypothetical protein [Desulfobacterales bacterium]